MRSFSKFGFVLGILLFHIEIATGDSPASDSHADIQTHSITSCMTTACHGSNVPDTKIWQRAGKIWLDQDPHSRAYSSLLSPTSVKIISRLVNEELEPSSQSYRDVLNARCVSCHASENAPEKDRVLGADCQVCHGRADAWGSEHYSRDFKELGRSRFENTKMLNVESMTSRARICASCHIGELNRSSEPNLGKDREVDHRLMAAGHPPMHFDFESYMRRYPVHWDPVHGDTRDETTGLGSPVGVQRWRVGKITVAITKLNLLATRAERSTGNSAKLNDWPELTEYSCTSCHHSLDPSSWRQDRSANFIANWDDWCISQLDCSVREQSRDQLMSQLTTLKRSVEQLSPEPRQVAINASSLRRWLEVELNHVSSPSENTVDRILPRLVSRLEHVDEIHNWESATQWYIATRVLSERIGVAGLNVPVPFVVEDPFLIPEKEPRLKSSKEFDTPKPFHSDMLKNYSNNLMQQLRTRP